MQTQSEKIIQARVSVEWLSKLDHWRRKQTVVPSRAASFRVLMELGLDVLNARDAAGPRDAA